MIWFLPEKSICYLKNNAKLMQIKVIIKYGF